MSKSPVKLTIEQIDRIKSLYNEGYTAPEIQKITKIALHIVRYHVERVQLSRYEHLDKDAPSSNDYNQLRAKYKKLIEIIIDL